MTRDEFWTLIESSQAMTDGNPDGQVAELGDHLEQQDPDEIVAFTEHLQGLLAESYTAPLLAACYLVNLEADDELFEAFRARIILLGREAFSAIVQNPDNLIDHIDEADLEDEDFIFATHELLHLPFLAWEEVTGDLPESMPLKLEPVDLRGKIIETEEALREELPLLYQKLG